LPHACLSLSLNVITKLDFPNVYPGLHGTRHSVFKSIIKSGLLIPGSMDGVAIGVENGSAYGSGIYVANLNEAWLSEGFCDKPAMFVCAVICSQHVKPGGWDAKVVFDAGHVVPLFLASSPAFCSELFGWDPRFDRINPCSMPIRSLLSNSDITVQALNNAHCSVAVARWFGYKLKDLVAGGFQLSELVSAGYSCAALQKAGVSSIIDLKEAGFDARQLREAGFEFHQLMDAGFDALQLRDAGFAASVLCSGGFKVSELRAAGLSIADLRASGFTVTTCGWHVSPLPSSKKHSMQLSCGPAASVLFSCAMQTSISFNCKVQASMPLSSTKQASNLLICDAVHLYSPLSNATAPHGLHSSRYRAASPSLLPSLVAIHAVSPSLLRMKAIPFDSLRNVCKSSLTAPLRKECVSLAAGLDTVEIFGPVASPLLRCSVEDEHCYVTFDAAQICNLA